MISELFSLKGVLSKCNVLTKCIYFVYLFKTR